MSYTVIISSGWNQCMEDFRGEGMVDEYLKYIRSCLYTRLFISNER